MSSDETVEKDCPLCMEQLEYDDLNFYPCSCEYQLCRFCWHRIRTDGDGLCPACRQPYPENPVTFKPLSKEQMHKIKAEKREKQQKEKQKVSDNRKHLSNLRVIQKNLVYVVGLSERVANVEILKRAEYFGRYGRIHKVVVGPPPHVQQGQTSTSVSHTAYVTYHRWEDALRCISSLNNSTVDGRSLKASLGTTKYCSSFLRNVQCTKTDCMYLHEIADDTSSFTKEDMQQGKHTEYERALAERALHRGGGAAAQTSSNADVKLTDRSASPTIDGSGTGNNNDDDRKAAGSRGGRRRGGRNKVHRDRSHSEEDGGKTARGNARPDKRLARGEGGGQRSNDHNKRMALTHTGSLDTINANSYDAANSLDLNFSPPDTDDEWDFDMAEEAVDASAISRAWPDEAFLPPPPGFGDAAHAQLSSTDRLLAVLTNKPHPNHVDRVASVDSTTDDTTSSSVTATDISSTLTGANALEQTSNTTDWQEAFGAIHRLYPQQMSRQHAMESEAKKAAPDTLLAMVTSSTTRPTNAMTATTTAGGSTSVLDTLNAPVEATGYLPMSLLSDNEDDLGFDPFSESSKGLAAMVEEEQMREQQRNAPWQPPTSTHPPPSSFALGTTSSSYPTPPPGMYAGGPSSTTHYLENAFNGMPPMHRQHSPAHHHTSMPPPPSFMQRNVAPPPPPPNHNRHGMMPPSHMLGMPPPPMHNMPHISRSISPSMQDDAWMAGLKAALPNVNIRDASQPHHRWPPSNVSGSHSGMNGPADFNHPPPPHHMPLNLRPPPPPPPNIFGTTPWSSITPPPPPPGFHSPNPPRM